MRRSIELNWLSRHHKQIPLPNLYYDETLTDYGGIYYSPWPEPHDHEGKEFYAPNGLIVVSTHPECIDDFESTLAHEWKHHHQEFNGWNKEYLNGLEDYDWSDYDTYDEEIKRYFRENDFELDALRFEVKMVGFEITKERLDRVLYEH
jgi:hypothetical protein